MKWRENSRVVFITSLESHLRPCFTQSHAPLLVLSNSHWQIRQLVTLERRRSMCTGQGLKSKCQKTNMESDIQPIHSEFHFNFSLNHYHKVVLADLEEIKVF
jgi:hypothetical protein